MKRRIVIAVLVVVCILPMLADSSYFNLGVGVSLSGRSDSVSSMTLDVAYVPFDSKLLNPVFKAWSGASWDGHDSGFSFDGLGLGLCLEIGRFSWNPLQFTLSNPGPWSPSLTAGFVFLHQGIGGISLYFEASPFRTMDKDYVYEWFSPFVLLDMQSLGLAAVNYLWGVTFFRFTPLYHV